MASETERAQKAAHKGVQREKIEEYAALDEEAAQSKQTVM